MTRRLLVVIGGGEHARVVIDAARSSDEWEVAGIVDGAAIERTVALFGVPCIGDDAAFLGALADPRSAGRPALILGVGGIGVPVARRAAVARYDDVAAGAWATIVHPTAWVSSTAALGPGAVVLAGAIVNAGAVVGPHAIVNTGAVVEHDAEIGAFAHVGPGAVVGGGAVLCAGAFAGMGSLVRDHVTVGVDAVLAMGAVVITDVPAGLTVLGLPARPAPSRR